MTRPKKGATTAEGRKSHASNMWDALIAFIQAYGDACRADEMKGGSDPASMPIIEAELTLAMAKLNAHIDRMRREYE